MNSNIAIKVENISKVFPLRHPRKDENGNLVHEHWALKDISFEVNKGESVGIIGPNGSGKSTLLKILAGVIKPTSGKITIHGRVASILEIGAGFHPELSGRENVFLNGQIHGFSKKEIEGEFDEIVEFSGIKEFIEEPVKNYSSGMYLRLAFSIMAHLDFDVYLFDEVLSVGDEEFRRKAQDKIFNLFREKKTNLLVSHEINSLENRNIYIKLSYGIIEKISTDRELLTEYIENTIQEKEIKIHTENIVKTNLDDVVKFKEPTNIKLISVSLLQDLKDGKSFLSSLPFKIRIEYEKLTDECTIDVILSINDINGAVLLTAASFLELGISDKMKRGVYKLECELPTPLFNSQIYSIDLTFIKDLRLKSDLLSPELKLKETDIHNNFELEAIYKDIIWFKPIFNLENKSFNIESMNIKSGLLLKTKWK